MKWMLVVATLWSGGVESDNRPFINQSTHEASEEACKANQTPAGAEAWRLRVLKGLDEDTIKSIGVPVRIEATCVLGIDV